MLNKYTQVQIYREYAIESLKQALCNLQSYDTKSSLLHIKDTIECMDKMNSLSKDE